jgi:D-alanyl-D-alanine carboxypeptidase
MKRASVHLLFLAILGVATLAVPPTRPSPGPSAPVAVEETGSVASVATRLIGQGGLVPAVAAAPRSEQLVAPGPQPQAPAAAPAPRVWVQNHRPTDLFAGPGADAASLGQVNQFTTFQLVEADGGPRIKLFDPGRGVGRLPGTVWANPQDFGPAGPPSPLFELAVGGIDPITQRRIPERIGDTWPRIPSAEGAVVLDGESGAILYAKNAHARLAPASLTKILTSIVAIEQGRPQDRVRVDVDSRTMYDNTIMGLEPGEVLSLETLLYGLMLPSGNDAALAIARHIGGSDAAFVDLMNQKVRALGLENSQFRNPHGWDDRDQYASPYDLAVMSRYGMRDPLFYSLSASRVWEAEGYTLYNLNRLIGQYPGADGVKVGYTDDAGRCLVASATRNGRRVFVTVMRSNDPVGESRLLLDYAFHNFRW